MAKKQIAENQWDLERRIRPTGPWGDRIEYAGPALFAFRPGEVIVNGGKQRAAKAAALVQEVLGVEIKPVQLAAGEWLLSRAGNADNQPIDVAAAVEALREAGFVAEPNVVFFNHSYYGGCGCGCCDPCGGFGSNPFSSNPFSSNPFSSNPFSSNPFSSNPFSSNPFSSNPFSSNPFSSNPFSSNPFSSNPFSSNPFSSNGWAETGVRPSSARPASKPNSTTYAVAPGPARVIVLDTGIAKKSQIPSLLKQDTHTKAADHDRDSADEARDGFLDPSSGHGTFIAGIVEQLAPGHDVHCVGVLNTFGEGDAAMIINRIDELIVNGLIDKDTIVNMSFGSYGDLQMSALGRAVKRLQDKGAVVVASAGNDGTCVPSYPAAFPGVVSVGSIEPTGRAPYSNFGPWVRACAPGTKITSSFFKLFNGDIAPEAGEDIDSFKSWAEWTGTSFAAPVVAAALVRHMDIAQCSAQDAVAAIVDGLSLGRFPGLGTVVNLAPADA